MHIITLLSKVQRSEGEEKKTNAANYTVSILLIVWMH